jgi:hypothetical protein
MEKIIHKQRRSGLTYETELELLAEVYQRALESYRRRKKEAETAVARRTAEQEAAGDE